MIAIPVQIVMPMILQQPTFDSSFDAYAPWMDTLNSNYYQECTKYDKEGIKAIQLKFPVCLLNLRSHWDSYQMM